MGRQDITPELEPAAIRRFTKALLDDLRALERILAEGMIESGARRFGAEQEVFLVGQDWRPAPIATQVLAQLDDERFTTELALFNAEINLEPMRLGGECFSQLEQELTKLLGQIDAAARSVGGTVVLSGILPSLSKSDLSIENITPRPRYFALNEAVTRLRGGPLRLHIQGTDELNIEHDSVMLEACNTSFQVHYQVSADEFVRLYNVAQLIAAPVVAAAANSPLLFGKRLWKETRIALFQQSVDTRSASPHMRELSPRVRFGERWLKGSVVDAFEEDIARFMVLMASEVSENPFDVLADGRAPELHALQMHNSTVYRWNRPCYGLTNGTPHLRIECRALPSGPSIVDEVANAAFWIGLLCGASEEYGDPASRMDFDDAKANFIASATRGLRAEFTWIDGQTISAPELISDQLLPLARQGLRAVEVAQSDIDRYLEIIEMRVEGRCTGARWMLESLSGMKGKGRTSERMAALTAGMVKRQRSGKSCHEWEPARLEEAGGLKFNYTLVDQFMTTDLFTVHEDELVDLAAFLMDRKQIRHVLVEDHNHKLVGIVSYRSLVRLLAQRGLQDAGSSVPVKDIMEANPITITPETLSVDAIQLMREKRVSALPVIKNEKLVGVITEMDFLDLASDLLSEKLQAEKDSGE